jgi:hypothetical protein
VGALELLYRCGRPLADQASSQPSPDCLERLQSEQVSKSQHVTLHMRAILIDWMIEVAVEYR